MIPTGYFTWHNTRYYSIGNGHFFGFLSQARYAVHRQQHPTDPDFGLLESAPGDFMQEDSAIP